MTFTNQKLSFEFFFSEPEEEKEGKDSRPIRTRLSTGSIHMNGTTTIAVAKEIENNSKLLTKGKIQFYHFSSLYFICLWQCFSSE